MVLKNMKMPLSETLYTVYISLRYFGRFFYETLCNLDTVHSNHTVILFWLILFFLQTQFVLVVLHTGYNMVTDCPFPQGFNYAVFIYAFTLIALFSNFYVKAYSKKTVKSS